MRIALAPSLLFQAHVGQAVRMNDMGEQHAGSSLAVGQAVAAAAAWLPPGPAKELLTLLRPCAPCMDFERFGEQHDGGYIMCKDGLHQGLDGAFSFGVNGFDGWGMSVASQFRLPLHEYDCFNGKAPSKCHGCDVHFHRKCIGASGSTRQWQSTGQTVGQQSAFSFVRDFIKGLVGRLAGRPAGEPHGKLKKYTTFTEELQKIGLGEDDRSLLVKMDVEGAETDILAEEPLQNLRKVRQLVLEVHDIGPGNAAKFLPLARKMRDAGFAVAHLHGNNWNGVATFGEFSVPQVLEVTYVQAPSGGCTADVPMHLPQDEPNNPKESELPDPVLPTSS